MRTFVFCILSFCIITIISAVPASYARDISFTWTANTDDIDGYKLYVLERATGGVTKSNATDIVELEEVTSYTYQNLDDTLTYHFALTAFRGSLESDFSTEITVPPIDVPAAGDLPPGSIAFDQIETVAYSNQDKEGTVTVEDNGATLALTGNRWVKTSQSYNITPETIIEFDFNSTVTGEIHGIGFDEDNELTNDKRIFQFGGTSTWDTAIQIDQRYQESDMGNWVHFAIAVGRYYTGSNMNLVFVNDHDNDPANGNGWFSNVIIHEGDLAPPPAATPPPTSSITAVTIDNGDQETSSTGNWLDSGGIDYYGTVSVYSKKAGDTYRYETSLNGQYEIELRWTEWPSRCTNVPVRVYNGSTLIDTQTVNQQKNGGNWNSQGSYTFTGTGAIVIVSQDDSCSTNADAIRIISSEPAPTATGSIVDNGDSATASTGEWLTSGGADPYGTGSVYSKTADGTYTFTASLKGQYDISLWWTEWPSRCTDVPVKIYDNSTLVDTLTVNQHTNGGKWNLQGRYTFSGTGRVVIVSQGESCSTNADAVQFNEVK